MPAVELSYFQSTILAVIQGLTEFLPISSSAHLLLPRFLLDWPDQGVAFDVIVHLGSLFAVLFYFRIEIRQLFVGWLWSLKIIVRGQLQWSEQSSTDSRQGDAILAWLLILATLPAGFVGLIWQEDIVSFGREGTALALSSIVFGIVLLIADRYSTKTHELTKLNWKSALLIGMAQILALIPGTSRSGITMTAGLMLGLNRSSASRFSFLMAIPIIAGSSIIEIGVLLSVGTELATWLQLISALIISAIVAFMCIHLFLRAIERIGFLPFVIYRCLLGLLILILGVS